MDDLISRQAAIEAITAQNGVVDKSVAKRVLAQLPSAQPDRGYIEQIKWERDLAIRQLADLGYGLGEKPRTSGDFISRQAAIKAICEDGTWLESQGCTEITMAERKQRDADILGELPSADNDSLYKKLNEAHNEGYDVGYWAGRRDYEQKWIPCGERMPEPDERVLVYTVGKEFHVWDAMPHRAESYAWEDEEGLYHSLYEVDLWMPLPKPYKGERKEE